VSKNRLSLSLVIPVYNEEHHLRDCLEAIELLTEKPDEVIVVDNNSTDDTVKIAKSFPFVTLLRERKQGVLPTRNAGFAAAKYDIIGRIDADTQLAPSWVTEVKRIFSKEEVTAATGPVFFYDMPLGRKNYVVEHAFKLPLYKYNKGFPFLLGANMAIRRKAWEKVKSDLCDDNTIFEDMDLAIHLYHRKMKIVYDSRLRAGASSRRFDDRPKDFYRYIHMNQKTFNKHKMRPAGATVAVAGYTLGYLILGPVRRAYDPKLGKRTLRRLIRGNEARSNPMG
jgi:glycosyltransferase involved in cell wall biosynthesis